MGDTDHMAIPGANFANDFFAVVRTVVVDEYDLVVDFQILEGLLQPS